MTTRTMNHADLPKTEKGLGTRILKALVAISATSRYAHAAKRASQLQALSDEQLAARGLTRDRIAYEAFGNCFYL